MCILEKLTPDICYSLGECKEDYGGYFIIDGKEKTIIPQETFADNMLYVRKYKEGENYLYSSEIRSVSEDTSKPVRTTSVKMMSPSATHSNKQIVVEVPNVRKPIPLFILMRALGVISDKEIIDLLEELLQDYKDQSNLKKIESLEKELMNNLDENSYSELIRLKSQLNRD